MTMTMTLQQLYEVDDYQWLETTIQLLRSHQLDRLDLGHLIEELEALGSEKRHAVESLLEQVMRHLLFLQYWTEEYEQNANHWQAELYSFRTQLNRKLTTNLRLHLDNEYCNLYTDAAGYVQRKAGFKLELPALCPYALEQLLDVEWLP